MEDASGREGVELNSNLEKWWGRKKRCLVLTWQSDANFLDGRVVFFLQLKFFNILVVNLFIIELVVEHDFVLCHGVGKTWVRKDVR